MEKITFQGNALTLAGKAVKVGDVAADFSVADKDLKEVKLADFKGKIKIFTTFPSIDTPVCDLQVREFNKRAVGLDKEVIVVGISKDLPFAQSRYCAAHGIDKVVMLSDYKNSSFADNYGVLIKELNLLARTIMIVDKNDKLVYRQVVSEITHAPDYDEALKKLAEVVK